MEFAPVSLGKCYAVNRDFWVWLVDGLDHVRPRVPPYDKVINNQDVFGVYLLGFIVRLV